MKHKLTGLIFLFVLIPSTSFAETLSFGPIKLGSGKDEAYKAISTVSGATCSDAYCDFNLYLNGALVKITPSITNEKLTRLRLTFFTEDYDKVKNYFLKIYGSPASSNGDNASWNPKGGKASLISGHSISSATVEVVTPQVVPAHNDYPVPIPEFEKIVNQALDAIDEMEAIYSLHYSKSKAEEVFFRFNTVMNKFKRYLEVWPPGDEGEVAYKLEKTCLLYETLERVSPEEITPGLNDKARTSAKEARAAFRNFKKKAKNKSKKI